MSGRVFEKKNLSSEIIQIDKQKLFIIWYVHVKNITKRSKDLMRLISAECEQPFLLLTVQQVLVYIVCLELFTFTAWVWPVEFYNN